MKPSRGDVWLVDLNPVRGHEQAGIRPALIVSVNMFNYGPAGLVVVAPLTTKDRAIPLHVPVCPGEAGLSEASFIKCDNLRSIAVDRLSKKIGSVSPRTLLLVEDRVRILLGL